MEWHEAIDAVRPHVFRITTPQGSGTGFLLRVAGERGLIAVATAAHVIDHAHFWEQPLRLEHVVTGHSTLLRHDERAIRLSYDTDTAAILFEGEIPGMPDAPLELVLRDRSLKQGVRVGWLGFPGVRLSTLCFFTGSISAYVKAEHSYLVDGVAINGVSGGPVFRLGHNGAELVGLVSAYMPNRATGESLPGLAVIRDVEDLHAAADKIQSFTEAKEGETPAEPSGHGPRPGEDVLTRKP